MKKGIIVLFIISTFFPCIASATYHISSLSVQNRVYENGNHLNRLAIEVVDANNQYAPTDVLGSFELTDPNGKIMTVDMPLRFNTSYETDCSYDANSGKWIYKPFYFYSAYATEFSDQLIKGTYNLKFTDKDGETSNKSYVFNQIVDLPVIHSSSYNYYRDQDGNFIWHWQVPYIDPNLNTSARAWISIYGEQGKYLGEFYVRVPTQLGMLFIPNDIYEQILPIGKTFKLGTRINTNDGNNRSYSTEVPIRDLPPVGCSAAIDGNLSLMVPNVSYDNPISGEQSLWLNFAYEVNPTYPTLLLFKLTNSGSIEASSYSCAPSTLSYNLKLHIPDVLLPDGITHLWVDLEYSDALSNEANTYFVVTNFGVVSS
jgi:hypothetical protein